MKRRGLGGARGAGAKLQGGGGAAFAADTFAHKAVGESCFSDPCAMCAAHGRGAEWTAGSRGPHWQLAGVQSKLRGHRHQVDSLAAVPDGK